MFHNSAFTPLFTGQLLSGLNVICYWCAGSTNKIVHLLLYASLVHVKVSSLFHSNERIAIRVPKSMWHLSTHILLSSSPKMQNRMAILLCNLKPAKMRGVISQAMVMCASSPEKVEILAPPPGAVPGDRITFEGFPGK